MQVTPVTVVVTNFNGAATIATALDSVLEQTLQPTRIIVVDDGSTDGSPTVIDEYRDRDGRVEVIALPENRGVSAARNAGLAAAGTELVALLDGDDIWLPEHLATVVPLVRDNPEVALGFSLVRTFGSQDRVWEADLPALQVVDAFMPSVARCVAQTSSVVVRRKMVLDIGGYATDLRHCQDYDMYMRLAYRHPFISTHECTVWYRRHDSSNSHKLRESRRQEYQSRKRFLAEVRHERSGDHEFMARLHGAMSQAYDQRFREAWGQRDLAMFSFLPELADAVPGGDQVVERWWKRRTLIPVARAWDAIPEPVRRGVRAVARGLRG